jgi:NADPH-dependent 2,4-dienoyl-CoA reductase/sulfur reductase-like enzyme
MNATVLVVGAGLAGARTAETLRALGWGGRIVLAGEERHAPYERPALSKELLAGTRSELALRPDGFWERQGIDLALGRRVHAIDVARRTALVGDETVAWNALVLATGARARRLDGPHVHVLRTLDDARALLAAVTPLSRVAIVGAGFIGTEVASTLLPRAASVTVVDPLPAPLHQVLGPDVGRMLAARYRSAGVELRLGVGVARLDGDVVLSDGERLPADVVVVGIGAQPESPFGGVVETDECGRTKWSGVYACGDVASWWRPSLDRRVRVEHWTSAAGQARAVAAAIVGEPAPFDDVPYFWSDQFGMRLQHVGHAGEWHAVVLEGDENAFTARYVDREGKLLAALAANRSELVGPLRKELAA